MAKTTEPPAATPGAPNEPVGETCRQTTSRRRDAARLDAHLGVWRFRRPWPYSGAGTGTELDCEERERIGVAA